MTEVVGRILSGDSNALQLRVNRNSEAAGDRLELGLVKEVSIDLYCINIFASQE